MATESYKITMVLGRVELGRPTGRIRTDPDGWSYQEYTPTRYFDGSGKLEREDAFQPSVRWRDMDPR